MTNANEPPQGFPDIEVFQENWLKFATQAQKLVTSFLSTNAINKHQVNMDPMAVGRAFLDLSTRVLSEPGSIIEYQTRFWQDYMKLWQQSSNPALHTPVISPDPTDKRFRHPDWTENQVYDFIKQSYLLTARLLRDVARSSNDLDAHDARKLDFFTGQFIDAMSPTNFALTNPEVMRRTLETGGENLLRGLDNLLADIERGRDGFTVRQTDLAAFGLGENIATTPGDVIFRNELIELIQYAPTTKKVFKRPLLIIPPWINKYYILDLTPENSLVGWLLDQGHTVFIISWRNPDSSHAELGFDDYMTLGPLAALNAITEATGETAIHPMGYCIGGTLLACTLAYLAETGQAARAPAATFLVTQVDFSEAGELRLFVDDDQIRNMRTMMAETGYLDGSAMAMTFNMLRANDLIWSFVVSNYLMGDTPFPFDLLYWNSDSTRVPRANHEFYLREMYQQNNLVNPGQIVLKNIPIDLGKITIPTYIQAAETDHICPSRSVYKAARIFSGDNRFILAGSGHIAGVVNPPSARKYYYLTNDQHPDSAEDWLLSAKRNEGSWWPDWQAWAAPTSGPKVKARIPGTGKLPVIEPAPGSYVKIR